MNEELKWKEDRFLLALKVGVYFVLNVIGVATGVYAYAVKPFAATRLLTGIGAAIYLLGMGVFTLLLQHYLTPTIYRGSQGRKTLWLCSTMLYPQAIYSVNACIKGGKSFEFHIPVGAWLTAEGEIVGEAVYGDLKSQLKLD